MVNSNPKSISNSLYVLKGLACIGVVLMHSIPSTILGNLFVELCSFAVPAFYLITGYYSYNVSIEKIKARIFKLLKFFACCCLLYVLLRVGLYSITGGLTEYLSSFISIKNIINTVVFCWTTIWGPGWYVVGMIETYILWIFAKKTNKTNILLKLTPLFFALGVTITIICNTYFSGFGRFIFLGRSLPWYLAGITIRERVENNNLEISNKKICIIGILGYCVSILQILFETKMKFGYIGTLVYSMCLFLFFINNNKKIYCNILQSIGTKYSTMIYAYHKAVIALVMYSFEYLSFSGTIANIIYPILCLLLTVIFSAMLNKIRNHLLKTHLIY